MTSSRPDPRREISPLEERIRGEAGRAGFGVSEQERCRAIAADTVLDQIVCTRESLAETQRGAVRARTILRVARDRGNPDRT